MKREIIKGITKLETRKFTSEVFSDVIMATTFSIHNRFNFSEDFENKYLSIIKKYNKEEQKIFCEVACNLYIYISKQIETGIYSDVLGEIFHELGQHNKHQGQFFTPYPISLLCAKMTIREKPTDKIFKIHEPTCGSGGMIVAMLQELNSLHVNYTRECLIICGDIDFRCVCMTYLQLSLLGASAIIYHQNALTMETWRELHTPAYIMQYLHFKNALKESKEEYIKKVYTQRELF